MICLVSITPVSGGQEDMKHPPLGLLYLGSALEEAGFDVKIYHIAPSELEKTVKDVVKQSPLFVGVSVFTGLWTYYAAVFSEKVRLLDDRILIVWGGHHSSLIPEQCLRESFVDIVCIGEGEKTVVELAKTIDAKKSLDTILGIGYKINGEICINNPRPFIENLDALPLDWSLIDVENYLASPVSQGMRTTSFYSSRGCPYNCAFCSSARFCNRRWRCHSVDYVVDNISFLRDKFSVDSVFFADDNFFVNKKRALTIIERLKELGIQTRTADVRINDISDEIMERLSEMGVTGLFFGWESGVDRLLELMHKGFNRETIIEKAKVIAKYPDVSVWGSGMLALPTEREEETAQTILTGLELSHILPNSTIGFVPYMPLPGTEFLALAAQGGFEMPRNAKDWARADIFSDEYEISWLPWVTDQKLKNIKMTSRYARTMLKRSRNDSSVVSEARNVFYKTACKRISAQNFFLPMDLKMYQYLKLLVSIVGKIFW